MIIRGGITVHLNLSGQELSEQCWDENSVYLPLAVPVRFNVLGQDCGALHWVGFIPHAFILVRVWGMADPKLSGGLGTHYIPT